MPAPLVDLALWVADYYGSTPARALELVAPKRRAPRGARPSPAERESLGGEPEPEALTVEQREAVEQIVAALDEGVGEHVLLEGPTGSGKTEVYLQACAAALERGLGTIVLVPEIALAPQTVGRFRRRFGDSVAIVHSSLGAAERRDERDRIARGEARIVVGARSAVFAPMRGVGLIVVDEEHDTAYKQESDPRYDARTVAAKRAALEGAVAVYGSATPRPESWARLRRLSLAARIGAPMPSVRLVDLRREAGYPLSAPLLGALGRLVDDGGRAILLLNRRGVAPAIHCRACGISRRCVNCDVALTLHTDEALHCHHCGRVEAVPRECPECGSVELARIGAGTQRLEAELAKRLPELERFRLDADVVAPAGRGARRPRALPHGRAGSPRRDADGREGPPRPGVALAAVVDADTGLSLPDFRAEERTFQLVTQLAGRSGRDAPGRSSCRPSSPTPRRSATRSTTTSPGSSPGSSSGVRCSATRPSGISSPSSSRAPSRARHSPRSASCARGSGRRRPARPRARAAAARAPPRPASGEDDATPFGRTPRVGTARGRGAHDAQRRVDRRGGRRPAAPLTTLTRSSKTDVHPAAEGGDHDEERQLDAQERAPRASRSRRSASTPTPSCGCGPRRQRSTTSSRGSASGWRS